MYTILSSLNHLASLERENKADDFPHEISERTLKCHFNQFDWGFVKYDVLDVYMAWS